MPLKGKIRYRYKTLPSGEKQRLAFRGRKVVEVKGSKDKRGYTKTLNSL